MCIAKWKKPLWEDYILYDYISMTFWKSQNYSNIRKATAVKAACGSLLTCSPLNWWKKKNQPFKVCGNNPKDKQQRKKYQFQKKNSMTGQQEKWESVISEWSRSLCLESQVSQAEMCPQPPAARVWSSQPPRVFLHGEHTTPGFLILLTAPCPWGEALGECGGEMGISSAAPPTYARKSLPWGGVDSGKLRADGLILLSQEMNFIGKHAWKSSNLKVISRTVEVVVKGNGAGWGR